MSRKVESTMKSTKSTKSESNSSENLANVKVDDFDIKNYKLDPISDAIEGAQDISFPRYNYTSGEDEDGKFERFCVVTDVIEIKKGGIPKIDPKYRPTENDCLYFWLNLDQCEGGKKFMSNVLEPVDKLHDKKINKDSNKDFVVKLNKKTGKLVPVKDLKYLPCIKEFDPSKFKDEDDDTDEVKDASKIYKRTKISIATKYDKAAKPDDPREIKTLVYANDEDGDPMGEPLTVKTMEQIREYFPWGCKAQFCLEFNKFWIRKPEDGVKKCALSIKCLSMYIVEKPSVSKSTANVLGLSVFGITPKQLKNTDKPKADKIAETKVVEAKVIDAKKASESDSSSDSSDSSDSSSDSSDSESESSESEKKPKAKGGKAKSK